MQVSTTTESKENNVFETFHPYQIKMPRLDLWISPPGGFVSLQPPLLALHPLRQTKVHLKYATQYKSLVLFQPKHVRWSQQLKQWS